MKAQKLAHQLACIGTASVRSQRLCAYSILQTSLKSSQKTKTPARFKVFHDASAYYAVRLHLIALYNNRVVSIGERERRLVGPDIPGMPARVGDVLTGGAPAAGEAGARARVVVAGAAARALDVALVPEVPALRVPCAKKRRNDDTTVSAKFVITADTGKNIQHG
jgi:hypothetical protein